MVMVLCYECGLFDLDVELGVSFFDYYIYVIVFDGDIEEGVILEVLLLVVV